MIKITKLDELRNLNTAGTQDKWKIGNMWYKSDDFNHEGLAETICSDMLRKSNVERFAIYEPELIQYRGKILTGCKSENFLRPWERLVESLKLFETYNKDDKIKPDNESLLNPKQSIQDFINTMIDITNLTGFDQYLTQMFEFDMITLNPDRHYGNISVIEKDDKYNYAPFFDQGRSFALQDSLWDNGKLIEKIVDSVESRPFSGIFSKQTHLLEDISKSKPLKLEYTKDDLRNSLDKCSDIYPDEILKRAELIFDFQYEKYREYFISDKDKDLFINIINELEKYFSSPFTVISQNNELILKSNLDSEISYKIDTHYNVQAYKGTNIVDLDEILFKYPDEFQFYQKLFYFLRDDINIQNLDMSFEK